MFPIHINDGTKEMPTDDIFYVVAKEGIFLKKKMGIMESLAPVNNISILESVALSAQMHIPKIPAKPFARVLEFFKEVYREHRSECAVIIFYNEETEQFKIVVPEQKVSFASLDYDRLITVEDYTMVGTIHSHSSMSAFHSGVDDDDEKSFDGLHITLGDMDENEQSISSSIVANGYRFMVDPLDYVDGIKITTNVDESELRYRSKIYKVVDGKSVFDKEASKKSAYTVRKLDRRFVSTVPKSKRKFSRAWMNKVEKETYVYGYYHRGGAYGHGAGKPYSWGAWGPHYDPYIWQQYHKLGTKPPVHTIPPKPDDKKQPTLIPSTLPKEIETTQDIVDDEIIPCFTCKYRDEKIDLDDDFENEFYKCEKCDVVIGGDSDDLECPNCETDEYLVLLEASPDESHYVADIETSGDEAFASDMIICPYCNNKTPLIPPDNYCLYCYETINDISWEDMIIQQSEKDSGVYLDSQSEEANEEALKQLSEQSEENITKIPDPAKPEIPIQGKKLPLWKKALKNTFGGRT